MNANQIINMVTRMVMRRLIGRGMNAGFKALESRGSNAGRAAPQDGRNNPAPDTRAARQAMKMARRVSRF